MKNGNPLLEKNTLPSFDRIRVEHIEPAIDQILEKNREELKYLLGNTKNYTWDNFFQKIEDMEDRLQQVWSPASHLHAVADNSELRSVYNNCLKKLSDYSTEVGQNIDLFKAYNAFSKNPAFNAISKAQKKIITNTLRDFRLSLSLIHI